MKPIVHGLEAEYGDKLQFTYLDIDDPQAQTFKDQLGFRVQPHFFLLDEDGKILKIWLGMVSRNEFVSEFEKALGQ